MSVVREWRCQTPPGRFLKVNDETQLWDDVGDDGARIKCKLKCDTILLCYCESYLLNFPDLLFIIGSQALRERKATKLQLKDCKNPFDHITQQI